MRSTIKIVCAIVIAISAGGCGSGESGGAGPGEASEPVYTRTHVYLAPDGTVASSRMEIIKPGEQSTIALGPGAHDGIGTAGVTAYAQPCANADMDAFDQLNRQGNQICFYGSAPFPATLSLSAVTRYICDKNLNCYPVSWSGAVRSYRAGSETGWWSGSTNCGSWAAYDYINTASPCEQAATYINFSN